MTFKANKSRLKTPEKNFKFICLFDLKSETISDLTRPNEYSVL